MSLRDLSKDLLKQTDRRIERKLGILAATKPRYRTLDDGDKQVILDLLNKYKERMRKGIKITDRMIRDDRQKLFSNRFALGLSEVDLDQIYDLLESFKKED